MTKIAAPIACFVTDIEEQKQTSNYPSPFSEKVAGRAKRRLGDAFGLNNFGVNLTTLAPNAQSALFHRHKKADEFIYILEGTPTLITDEGEVLMEAGMCAGFPAQGSAHHLINNTDKPVVYLEIGDRLADDGVTYPNDDLEGKMNDQGQWVFSHKDGTPY